MTWFYAEIIGISINFKCLSKISSKFSYLSNATTPASSIRSMKIKNQFIAINQHGIHFRQTPSSTHFHVQKITEEKE